MNFPNSGTSELFYRIVKEVYALAATIRWAYFAHENNGIMDTIEILGIPVINTDFDTMNAELVRMLDEIGRAHV